MRLSRLQEIEQSSSHSLSSQEPLVAFITHSINHRLHQQHASHSCKKIPSHTLLRALHIFTANCWANLSKPFFVAPSASFLENSSSKKRRKLHVWTQWPCEIVELRTCSLGWGRKFRIGCRDGPGSDSWAFVEREKHSSLEYTVSSSYFLLIRRKVYMDTNSRRPELRGV